MTAIQAEEAITACLKSRESFKSLAMQYEIAGIDEIARIYRELAAVMDAGTRRLLRIKNGSED